MSSETSSKKLTLVLGATPNPSRYAYLATKRLLSSGHPVVLVGIKPGEIGGAPIHLDRPIPDEPVDTVTLYVGPKRQPEYYEYLLALKPKRILFNPGTENAELMKLARENGIEVEAACTLVLLASNGY